MRSYRFLQFTNVIGLLIITMTMITGCNNDDYSSDMDGKVLVKASIVCRGGAGTRATTYLDAENQYELIHDWWIVVVNPSTREIAAILEREDKSNDVERDEFEFFIEAGTYDVYSFANISKTAVEGLAGVGTLSVGGTMPDKFSDVEYDINSVIANGLDVDANLSTNHTYIPMTGKKTATFIENLKQSDEFEVIRMVAKLEFIFKNGSTKDITLNYIKFNPINTGNILLMPNYTTLTYDAETDPVLLTRNSYIKDGSGVPNFIKEFPTSTVINSNTYLDNTKWYTSKFYLRESLASSYTGNPSKHFLMNIGITREGKSEEVLYTITNKTITSGVDKIEFTGINRNDYVQIPIKFTDYIVDLKINYYPPIGGYPAIITTNADETEFYCTFATQGDFQIRPRVKDTATNTFLTYPDYDFEIKEILQIDGTDIFDIDPHIDTTTGEILGRLNTEEGTYKVSVEITVDLGSGAKQTFLRHIYITRKNA